MTEKSVFISSCSRRQLARRRPGRSAARRLAMSPALLFAVAGVLAFMAGRGGI